MERHARMSSKDYKAKINKVIINMRQRRFLRNRSNRLTNKDDLVTFISKVVLYKPLLMLYKNLILISKMSPQVFITNLDSTCGITLL